MTERVVYLAYRNPNAEPEARDMTACSHCRNKTFLIVHDQPEGFPMIQCAAEREALRAEVERLTRERAQVETVLSHELSKALAEVERLKANAERYQWMKRVHADGDESVTAWIGYYPADQWDEEIDRERLPSPTTEVPK